MFFLIVALFGLTFSPLALGEISNPNSISCQDYQAIVNRERLQSNKFQVMRQKILALCRESWVSGEEDYIKHFGEYTWQSANFSVMSNLAERFEHKGLSLSVYDILNYPRLNEILDECYPGKSVSAKFQQWYFKESLAYNDVVSYEDGTAAGIIAVIYGPLAFSKYLKTVPAIARATEYVTSLPAFARIATMRSWVIETFPFMAKTWVKYTVLFGGTAAGTAAYVGWKQIHAANNGAPVYVPNAFSSSSRKISKESAHPTAMEIIDGITAPDLFSSDLSGTSAAIEQATQQYGNAHGSMPLPNSDPFGDLTSSVKPTLDDCRQSIQTYDNDPVSDNLTNLKNRCEAYFHDVSYSLGLLKYPAVRCIALNDGITVKLKDQFESIVRLLPAAALTRR